MVEGRKYKSLSNYITYSTWLGMSGASKRYNTTVDFKNPEELRQWASNHPNGEKVWNEYVSSNYAKESCPTIARINVDKSYSPDNCMLVPHWLHRMIFPLLHGNSDVLGYSYNESIGQYAVTIPTALRGMFEYPIYGMVWARTEEDAINTRQEALERLRQMVNVYSYKIEI